jgi:2-hydroxychromene-2-carboxylate isomerase
MPVTIDYYMSLTSPLDVSRQRAVSPRSPARHGATVNIKPCKFGPIFEQTGGLPLPKRSPQRRAYRMMELKRWREVLGIPINLEPKHFPCDDTAATRLVIAAKLQGKNAHTAVAGAWPRACGNARKRSPIPRRSHWPPSAPALTPRSCARAVLRTRNSMGCMKSLPRRRCAAGVFGAPSYVLPSGEIFWGQDRLELLERALKKLAL